MGSAQYYQQSSAGALPDPRTFAFGGWTINRPAEIAANIPKVRAATNFFAQDSEGNDSNDGLDPIGLALTAGTYTVSTRTLTGSTSIGSYTFIPANNATWLVYIKTATDVTPGLYKLTSGSISGGTFTGVLSAVAETVNDGTLAAPLVNGTSITTSNGPMKTAPKGQTLINSTGNLGQRIRFKRNNRWYTLTAGFTCNGSQVTMDAYGVGDMPLFSTATSYFGIVGPWTQDLVSTNTFHQTKPSGMVWMWESTNPERAWTEVTSSTASSQTFTDLQLKALCNTIPYSFCFTSSGTVLNINPGTAYWLAGNPACNPNSSGAGEFSGTVLYEYNVDNTLVGFQTALGVDNVRVEGIKFRGFGQTKGSGSKYGILLNCNANGSLPCEQIVKDCEILYSAYHAVGFNGVVSAGNGGVAVFDNVRAGYCTLAPSSNSGTTVFVAFDGTTTTATNPCECYTINCSAPYGCLPSTEWINFSTNNLPQQLCFPPSQAYYQHTSGGAFGFYMRRGCTIGNGGSLYCPAGEAAPANVITPSSATNFSQYRSFVMDERMLGSPIMGVAMDFCAPGTIYINNIYELTPAFAGSPISQFPGGAMWNCTVRVDSKYQIDSSSNPSSFEGFFTNGGTPTLYNNLLDIAEPQVANSGSNFFAATSSPVCINNIFSAHDNEAGTALGDVLNITNNTANLSHNAYAAGLTAAQYSADTNGVTVSGQLSFNPPGINSTLIGAGLGVGLQYDQRWNPRPVNNPSIGPLEPTVSPLIAAELLTGAGAVPIQPGIRP